MAPIELIERLARETNALVYGQYDTITNLHSLGRFAARVAEECAKIVEGELEEASPRLAMAIREAFSQAPDGAPPPTSPPAAGSSR